MAAVQQQQEKRRGSGRAGWTPDDVAKRLLDFSAAVILLVCFLPSLLLIALLIRLSSPGPALFRQKRVGRNGATFTVLKFRTMRQGTLDMSTAAMQRQSVSPITHVGRMLRKTSFDELPQLINVLRGEMSLVGPRPALPSQTELNALRRAVGVDMLLPGITGWAQINGRDELSDEEKVACDRFYLDHRSLWMDLWILFRTVAPVLTGRGSR